MKNVATADGSFGDSLSIEMVFDRYDRRLYQVCYAMLLNPQDAEDAEQEIWIRVLQSRGTYDPLKSDPWPWIVTIGVNYCRDVLRKQLRRQKALGFVQSLAVLFINEHTEPADPRPLNLETRVDIDAALKQLNPDCRTIAILYFFCEFSGPKIVGMIKLPQATVYRYINKAREVLQNHLDSKDDDTKDDDNHE